MAPTTGPKKQREDEDREDRVRGDAGGEHPGTGAAGDLLVASSFGSTKAPTGRNVKKTSPIDSMSIPDAAQQAVCPSWTTIATASPATISGATDRGEEVVHAGDNEEVLRLLDRGGLDGANRRERR